MPELELKNIIKNQVQVARMEIEVDKIIEKSKSVGKLAQNFYSEFCGKAGLDRWEAGLDRWKEVFENYHDCISYYRIDSALLADRILIAHPTMAIIHQNRLENYYGVGFDGLEILLKANIFFPLAQHHSRYNNAGIVQGWNELLGKVQNESIPIPLYVDALNDGLARVWIEQSNKTNQEFENWLKENWLKDCNRPFSDFLDHYYNYLKEQQQQFGLLDSIPEGSVILHSSLQYSNLREATKERILKLKLLAEVLELCGNKKIGEEMNNILTNIMDKLNQLSQNKDEVLIAKYVFSLWQTFGAPWDYSRGGITEFSGRDLTLRQNPQKKETSTQDLDSMPAIELSVPNEVGGIVKETNIDDPQSIEGLANDRTDIITTLFNNKDFRNIIEKDPNFFFKVRKELRESGGGNLWNCYNAFLSSTLRSGILENAVRSRLFNLITVAASAIFGLIVGRVFGGDIGSTVGSVVFSIAAIEILRGKLLEAISLQRLDIPYDVRYNIDETLASRQLSKTGHPIQVLNLPYERSDSAYSRAILKRFLVSKFK